MATLYVDADHDDRSDLWTRVQAADDPDSPFATMQAAAMLAEPGDLIQVEPSTLGHADVLILADPNVYRGITHRRRNDQTDTLPNGENLGEDVIHVMGHVVDGQKPKCLKLEFYGLQNWEFSNFQRGYDLYTPEAFDTVDLLHRCEDLTFTQILYTGGGNYTLGCEGVIHWIECATFAPWTSGGSFLAGSGYHLVSVDTSTGIQYGGIHRFTDCHFEDCGGEDAVQASLGPPGVEAMLEFYGCTFANIQQVDHPTAPHTDAIQFLGGHSVKIINCIFMNCDSCFIASDGETGRITIINNMVFNGGNGFHGQGCAEWVILHNTVRTSGFSVAFGSRLNTSGGQPLFEQHVQMANNIIDAISFQEGTIIADDSVMEPNILISAPGYVLEWGTQLPGLPEFGFSDRLEEADIDQPYELANSPTISPGIGEGGSLVGFDLLDFELDAIENDILGRPYPVDRDVGAFQSDTDVIVGPVARAPYVTNRLPQGDNQPSTISWRADLYPVPGQEIDESTVNTDNAFVTAVNGDVAPAIVTLGAMDEDGYQRVTIDPQGYLRPLVLYTANLRDIADTEGSEISPVSWQARGPDASALLSPGDPGPTRLMAINGNIGSVP